MLAKRVFCYWLITRKIWGDDNMTVRQLINELMEYPLDMVVQVEIYNDFNPLRSSIAATYRDNMRDGHNKPTNEQCVLIYGDDI